MDLPALLAVLGVVELVALGVLPALETATPPVLILVVQDVQVQYRVLALDAPVTALVLVKTLANSPAPPLAAQLAFRLVQVNVLAHHKLRHNLKLFR